MRIGIDARMSAHSGIGTYVRGLVHGLARIDASHDYVVFVPPGAADWIPPRCRVHEIAAPIYGVRERWLLGRSIDRTRCDVVHVPHYNAPWRLRTPLVTTIHDTIQVLFPEFVPGWGRARVARTLLAHAARRSAAVITVSETTRRDVVQLFGVEAERLTVVYSGLDAAFHPPPPARVEAFRRRHGLIEPFVLFVGLLRPHKNVVRLVDAFARCAARSPTPLRLVVRGGRDGRFPAIDRALALGERDGGIVRLETRLDADDMPLLYAAARALACPSLYEGFGLPVLEAMACGTPVLAAQAGALPEIAGSAAIFTPPEDVDAMADALLRVTTDEALRAELVARGLRRAREFDWDETARRTLAVYERVASRSRTVERA